MSAKSVLMRP